MNRIVLGAFAALVLVGVGLFWLQGRAEVEEGAPPPAAPTVSPTGIPSADVAGRRITRNEMLSTRTDAFRDLDADGNNLLTFEEWAVTTSQRFDQADANGDRELTQKEFATTAPRPSSTRCNC